MTSSSATEYIHSLLRFGSKPGLDRIKKLLSAMGNPEQKLNIIHVAGTNGKGSVCTYTASALTAAGFKTGLYISPFVVCFNERIQIDGEYISNDDLEYYTRLVKDFSDSVYSAEDPITEFEFITALAFKYFADKDCDAVVLEVGLGGRLDATNVIKSPKASVITKIDLDHTGVLGETVAEIAAEKCGIIKQSCPVVTMYDNEGDALDVIKNVAEKCGSKLFVTAPPDSIITSDIFGSRFIYNKSEYAVSLAGKHQITNAITAITALKVAFPEIGDEAIKKGLKNAKFPARCEVISKDPFILLDGSHNPNGTTALNLLLKENGLNDCVGIVGFMADKDVSDALSKVTDRFSKFITVEVVSNKRSMTAKSLQELLKGFCDDVSSADCYQTALNMALETGKPIIVFGSLYLSGDIRPLLIQKKTN